MKTHNLVFICLFIAFAFLCCSKKNIANADMVKVEDSLVKTKTLQSEKLEDDTIVYMVVEQMPAFPGGEAAMHRFIMENLKYPAISQEEGIQGRIAVRFVVTKTGDIGEIKAIRGSFLSDSLISVLRRMPRWNPGMQDGRKVNVYYTLPMDIHLKK